MYMVGIDSILINGVHCDFILIWKKNCNFALEFAAVAIRLNYINYDLSAFRGADKVCDSDYAVQTAE